MKIDDSTIFSAGMILFLLALPLSGGCKSSTPAQDMVADYLYFKGVADAPLTAKCDFKMQAVYYGNWPVDLFLYMSLKNTGDMPLLLDPVSDKLGMVVRGDTRYAVALPKGAYPPSLESGESFDMRFRVYSDSLMGFFRRKFIDKVVYQFGQENASCTATFQPEKEPGPDSIQEDS